MVTIYNPFLKGPYEKDLVIIMSVLRDTSYLGLRFFQ